LRAEQITSRESAFRYSDNPTLHLLMWWMCIAPLLLAGIASAEQITAALAEESQASCQLQAETVQTRAQKVDYGHPSWLGSCASIYLDVGSNKGVQIRKLFEPELYPESQVLPMFNNSFGAPTERCKPATETGICALGLEPNPQHHDRLLKLEAAYQKNGWRVHFYFMAASTEDGQVSFTGMGGGADIGAHMTPVEDVAFVTVDGQAEKKASPEKKRKMEMSTLQWDVVPVQAVDLASFIQSLPARSVKLMKMDIEGAEFNVIDHMAEKGTLCKESIQEAFVEVHNVTHITTWANTSRWAGREPSADGLASFIQAQPCEDGTMKLVPLDDESYLEDVNEDFGSANPCRGGAQTSS